MITVGLTLTSARTGDVVPPSGTLTIADLSRDRMVFDSGAALGQASATIPLSGTGTEDAALEIRAVSLEDGGAATTPWTEAGTIGTDGSWSASLTLPRAPTWFVLQARLRDEPVVQATTTARFAVGHVFALWGQSEFARFWTSSSDFLAPVAIPDDGAVQMFWHDRGTPGAGGVRRHVVSDGDTHTAAFAAMAASLIAARPGEKFAIVHQTQSGTSFQDLCDDSISGPDDRSFADDAALHAEATADGLTSVGLLWPSWFASPRGFRADYAEAFQAVFTGTRPDGSAIAPGTTLFPGSGSTEFALDHSAAELYDPSETAIALAGPHSFTPATGDAHNSSGLEAIEDCRVSLRTLFTANTSPFTMIEAAEALDYLNGEPQTGGSYDAAGAEWGDTAHPNRRTENGQNRFARITAQGLLQAAGLTGWQIPTFDAATWSETLITLTSSAGPLTTAAFAAGGSDLVAGFDLNAAEVTTARIVGGAVEISGSFTAIDTLTFGRYGASGMRDAPADYFEDYWARYPLVAHTLADLEGIAVRPLPAPGVLANTLTPPSSLMTGSGTNAVRFDDEAPIGTNTGVYVGLADLTTAPTLANGTLFGISGGVIKIELLANGRIRLNTLKDGANATVVSSVFSASGTIVANSPHVIAAHIDLGSGYCRIWVNDVLAIDAAVTTSNPTFPTNRTLGFLADPLTFTNHLANTEIRRLALWRTGASPTGVLPGAMPDKEVSIAAPESDPWYVSAAG